MQMVLATIGKMEIGTFLALAGVLGHGCKPLQRPTLVLSSRVHQPVTDMGAPTRMQMAFQTETSIGPKRTARMLSQPNHHNGKTGFRWLGR